jgi:hypothetical protein
MIARSLVRRACVGLPEFCSSPAITPPANSRNFAM